MIAVSCYNTTPEQALSDFAKEIVAFKYTKISRCNKCTNISLY